VREQHRGGHDVGQAGVAGGGPGDAEGGNAHSGADGGGGCMGGATALADRRIRGRTDRGRSNAGGAAALCRLMRPWWGRTEEGATWVEPPSVQEVGASDGAASRERPVLLEIGTADHEMTSAPDGQVVVAATVEPQETPTASALAVTANASGNEGSSLSGSRRRRLVRMERPPDPMG
jgi:hypothetical protein